MPRRRLAHREPMVRWSLYVPVELAALIEHSVWDNLHNKPHYGKRQELIIRLLLRYADENNLRSAPIPRSTSTASKPEPSS